ncbi:MAG: hypothetical protein AAF609_26885 [Cyanobacteria bacterium P01_C01_bin.120]
MASDSSHSPESSEEGLAIAVRNFLIAVFLSGLPILAYLWLSVDMTYGSWTALGTGRLVSAASVPLLFGTLALYRGQQVIRFLSNLLESGNLPF